MEKDPELSVKNIDRDTDGDGKDDKFINGITKVTRDKQTGKYKNVNNGKGKIILDDNVVGSYTNAKNQFENEAGHTLLESTLFHEAVHYGRAKTGKENRIKAFGPKGVKSRSLEAGKEFEKQAYGRDIGRFSVKSYIIKNKK